ncbi:hypothetical protein ES705_25482 [subsurface metagenome]
MDELELLLSTFKGENYEKTLFSLWKHFPYDDRDPDRLAEAHVNFYKRHKFDLMKVSPHGRYSNVDFGCEIDKEYDPVTGSTRCKNCIIKKLEDWETLEPVDVTEGEFGKQLKSLKLIHKELESLPKMMTIFSPLMVAAKLDPNLEKHIQTNPETVKEAMYIIHSVMEEFSLAAVEEGANGLFIASQYFRKTSLDWKDVESFEIYFLDKIIKRAGQKASFSVIHIHGLDIAFDKVSTQLTAEAVNWHDQLTWPNIEEAAEIYKGGLLAGIDEKVLLLNERPEEIKSQIQETLNLVEKTDNRIIISPGCVIPYKIPDEKLDIIGETIRAFNKRW